MTRLGRCLLGAMLPLALGPAQARDLFDPSWAGVATDQRAARVGDIITVVVYQNAEARNAAENTARKRNTLDGDLQTGSTSESASLSLGGDYAGRGEIRRSESFVTQISVAVTEILPNGDFLVGGAQLMQINGEKTVVRVRGRVRPIDITAGNQILSTRIADAEISYDGKGFVSRSSKPGMLNVLFSLLGLIG